MSFPYSRITKEMLRDIRDHCSTNPECHGLACEHECPTHAELADLAYSAVDLIERMLVYADMSEGSKAWNKDAWAEARAFVKRMSGEDDEPPV